MSRETLDPDEAAESLERIRSVIDRSTRYTHIAWTGIMACGVVGVSAALIGRQLHVDPGARPGEFLCLWAGALVLSILLGVYTAARRAGAAAEPLVSRKLQVVLLGLLPHLVAAVLVTALLVQCGILALAPGFWMLFFGTGILAVGHVLDGEFQVAGWAFVLLGSVAFFLLQRSPHAAMLISFGGLHLALGAYRLLKERQWQRM